MRSIAPRVPPDDLATELVVLAAIADLAAQRLAGGRMQPDEVEATLRFQQAHLEDLAARLTAGPAELHQAA